MALFDGTSICIEFGGKEYKKVRDINQSVTSNGGKLAYLVNRSVDFVVTTKEMFDEFDSGKGSSSKLTSALKLNVPIVLEDYVRDCVLQEKKLPLNSYIVSRKEVNSKADTGTDSKYQLSSMSFFSDPSPLEIEPTSTVESDVESIAVWDEQKYEVPKQEIFYSKSGNYMSLELQVCSVTPAVSLYRIYTHKGAINEIEKNSASGSKETIPMKTLLDALDRYSSLAGEAVRNSYHRASLISTSGVIGSERSRLLRSQANSILPGQVQSLMIRIFKEANDRLSLTLKEVSLLGTMTLSTIETASAILLEIQKQIQLHNHNQIKTLSDEYYNSLPGIKKQEDINTLEQIDHHIELHRLLKDMLNIDEVYQLNSASINNIDLMYKSLNCDIEEVLSGSEEYNEVISKLSSNLSVMRIYKISREVERSQFDPKKIKQSQISLSWIKNV